MNQKLVIIPTYNEVENVEEITKSIFSLNEGFDILFVDDSSTDGTIEKIQSLTNQYPTQLFIEIRKNKEGLGKAYLHGFRWALKKTYQYIFEMDADFSHNPKDLNQLYVASLEGADVAIGSRYYNGVSVINWPMERVLLSYFASIYVRFVTGMKIQDTTAGFICYKRTVLEKCNLNNILFKGYAFQIEMKYTALRKGFRLTEVPITFTERSKGTSKMNKNIIFEALFSVFYLKFLKSYK
jgi:dolichol-phosphate mannosyltransferase